MKDFKKMEKHSVQTHIKTSLHSKFSVLIKNVTKKKVCIHSTNCELNSTAIYFSWLKFKRVFMKYMTKKYYDE